jgi:Mor family transcriptional regulator
MSFYQELVTTTERILVAQGVSPEQVTEIAQAVVDGIREDFGGLVIYTPKPTKKAQERDSEIRRLFFEESVRVKDLARRYCLTVRQIFRILK